MDWKSIANQAGCPKEICVKCGKAREKVYTVVGHQVTDAMKRAGCDKDGEYSGTEQKDYKSSLSQEPSKTKRRILESMSQIKEESYTDCGCNAGFRQGIILDPFWKGKYMLITGNALDELKKLDSNSVDCVITSPPYWSLRKYDIPDVVFDGDANCEHEWGEVISARTDETGFERNRRGLNRAAELADGNKRFATTENPPIRRESQFCVKCSAWKGQLGLEPTFEFYLQHLIQVFDEVKRVLKPTGTCWVNIADCYSGSGKGIGTDRDKCKEVFTDDDIQKTDWSNVSVPAKSLCLIPYRFAEAMVDRGWILRNIIIWRKPNCMPTSAKDRFTVDFEPIFFFTKSQSYWFEQQFDEYTEPINRWGGVKLEAKEGKGSWDAGTGQTTYRDRSLRPNPMGRNRRCVWDISTQPYPEAHFATFPEELINPIIRAGCPKEICVECGTAVEKIIEIEKEPTRPGLVTGTKKSGKDNDPNKNLHTRDPQRHIIVGAKEIGVKKCECNAEFKAGTVLDPFCGSGTTMRVAKKLGRKSIGIDLGYESLVSKKTNNVQGEWF